jgi:hypothetical protein
MSRLPVLLFWLALAVPFVLRTPDDSYSHDYDGHLGYSQFLNDHHRLPHAGEGWEGNQPPLYYLLIHPLAVGTPRHTLYVRFFAIALGAIALMLIQSTLETLGVSSIVRLASLLFLASTPAFVFSFSSYNNDVLSIFLGILLWTMFIRYVRNPTLRLALGLGLISLAGSLSKYSFGAAIVSVLVAALYAWRRGLLSNLFLKRLVLGQLIVAPFIFGWLYVHNVRSSGHWLAINSLNVPLQQLPHSRLETILTPPGFTSWEWTTPFADEFLPVGKKNSLTAYALVTSVFGEYNLRQIQDFWIWLILWIHILWSAYALSQISRSRMNEILGIALAMGWIALAGYLWGIPFGSAMDFRHVAWVWVPLALLSTGALQSLWDSPRKRATRWALSLIFATCLLQWTLIASL